MIKIRERSLVLRYALNLERITSDIVAYLLDIENREKSYSLGSKSSALSFNQKINLLLDNASITKEEKFKLEAFASIRNQFMHNSKANSYRDAFDAVDGLENKMKKLYPDIFDTNIEKDLKKCFELLYKDCIKILISFKGGVNKKMKAVSESKMYKEYFDKLEFAAEENFSDFEEFVRQHDGDIDKAYLLQIIRLMKITVLTSPVMDNESAFKKLSHK